MLAVCSQHSLLSQWHPVIGHVGKAGRRVPATKPLAFQAPSHSLLQAFHSRAGKAFLLDECVNVHLGKEEERLMTTGEAGCLVQRPGLCRVQRCCCLGLKRVITV